MSLNIQTTNGLLEIGGKITKEKIISALGYTPADKDYNNLENKPNISDDGSGEFKITDNLGNIIAIIDGTGVHSVDFIIKGESLTEKLQSLDAKPGFSGDYNDLINKPNILDDGNGTLTVADNDGNVILLIDSEGIRTTDVHIGDETLTNIIDKLNEHIEKYTNITDDGSDYFAINDPSGNTIMQIDEEGILTTGLRVKDQDIVETLNDHIDNTDIHVTAEEKEKWNKNTGASSWNDLTDKPEFAKVATTGLYNDLIGVPTVRELTATDNGNGRVTLSYTTVTVGTAIAEEGEF